MNFKNLVISIGFVVSTGASATQYIDSCGTTITQSGVYHLSQDLDCSGQANPIAIKVLNTSQVRIELKGHELKGRPNGTYGGQGTGILVFNSENVEIDGSSSNSRIRNFQSGIKVQNSRRVKIDGDYMTLEKNTVGYLGLNSFHQHVKELRLNNKQRDLYFHSGQRLLVEKTKHESRALQGILTNNVKFFKFDRIEMKHNHNLRRGMILYNSSQGELDDLKVKETLVGVVLQGNRTHTIEIKDSKIDDNQNCDLQVISGADQPQLDDVDFDQSC